MLPINKQSIMGGSGSMISAIKTLKQNRAILKKRKIRKKEDFITSKVTQLHFKEVGKTELAPIIQKIQKKKRKELLFNQFILLMAIVTIITIGILLL